MCLAIAQRAGAVVPRAHLLAGADSNRNGAGLAFIKDGKVKIDKGYFDANAFADRYTELRLEYPNSPFLIHFRTATSGKLGKDNCHPFATKFGAFIHNGMFSWGGDGDKSDTAVMADLLFNTPARAVPLLAEKLKKAVGSNKIAYMTHAGGLFFTNESAGHWKDNVWYSNSCYVRGNYDRGGQAVSSNYSRYGDDNDPWRGLEDPNWE